MSDYPMVSVGAAVIRDATDLTPLPNTSPLSDIIEVWCSEHGPITDWLADTPVTRDRARRAAAAHAADSHDNLVDAVGWVR